MRRRIVVQDPDFYYKKQHEIRGNSNGNDLHNGHQIVIGSIGFDGKSKHYGVFVVLFDRITGARSLRNIKYLSEEQS